MFLKRRIVPTMLALWACMAIATAPASVEAQSVITPDAVAKKLRTLYPDQSFRDVNATPIPGIFEVTVGQAVNYVDGTGRYFLGGPLIDLRTNVNLSVAAVERAARIDVQILPLGDALKIVKGKGTQTIYVFSDPDCPYCRQLEANFEALDDTTIHVFLYPLVSIHPHAHARAINIWCANQPAIAWRSLMLEGKEPAEAHCDHPVERNLALGGRLGVNATPTIFLANGTRVEGAHSAAEVYAKASATQRGK